jgi:hypothetical protein
MIPHERVTLACDKGHPERFNFRGPGSRVALNAQPMRSVDAIALARTEWRR